MKPEIRGTGVTEIGKESPGSFIESYLRIFLLEQQNMYLGGLRRKK